MFTIYHKTKQKHNVYIVECFNMFIVNMEKIINDKIYSIEKEVF